MTTSICSIKLAANRNQEGHLWSKLPKVLSDYIGKIQEEDATGRFPASLTFTRKALDHVGGWPLTLRGDFDHQPMSRLNAVGMPADSCSVAAAGYVFLWRQTERITGKP